MDADIYSVTLAAGSSSRMPDDLAPKCCCKIGPVSVIENALQVYEQAGVEKHLVVVGCHAERVMEEVRRVRQDVVFAYQPSPVGTGDAARCGLDLLAATVRPEHVLICSSDKVVAPRVMCGIVEAYAEAEYDLCLLAGRVEHNPSGGRILTRDGRAQAIIEWPDIQVRQLAAALRGLAPGERPGTVARLAELTSQYVPRRDKLAAYAPALGEMLDAPADTEVSWDAVLACVNDIPDAFALPCGPVSAEEAAAATLCNLSLYVARFEPLLAAVRALGTDNVQGECYLTDAVSLLVASGRSVGLFRVDNPDDVMAFNTMDELEEVRRVHAMRAQKRVRYPTLEEWRNYFAQRDPQGIAAGAVRGLSEKIGPQRRCIVARSPGRVNLMGRHVDHQGGVSNLMTVDREIVIAASPREDDRVNLWNLQRADYPSCTFTFGELTADVVWEDWLRTLDLQYVQRLASASGADWANYIKGAALRLQHRFQDRQLIGMDAFVDGNITVGAGLSSSSALVVAAAEALSELNALNIRPKEFVDLCGEGEWFVGTRAGSGDHAAIMLGREREVFSISFIPFAVLGHHAFPDDCSLLVCHSGFSASNTENARERFNSRVACYHMAREIIKERLPQFAPRIQHLRDVSTRTLGLTLPALYRLLQDVPLRLGPDEVAAIGERSPDVAKCIAGLDDVSHLDFPVRDVALYGLAECERAIRAGGLLDSGDVEALGEMMNLSHDGDRVATWRPDREPFAWSATDGRLDSMIANACCLEPLAASGAALWRQPGAYGCSTPAIDLMVDTVLACEGVLGAQLAGAGLGGCIMALVRTGCEDAVREALVKGYYEPRSIEPQVSVCRPSHGSRILTSVESAS